MDFKKSIYILFVLLIASSCASTKSQLTQNTGSNSDAQQNGVSQTQLSEDEQNEFEYLFIEGLKQKQIGNISNAVSIFARCLEIDPNSAVCMYEMANLHYSNGDLTSAALLLEKAITIDKSNKWYKLLLAQIYQQRNQYDKAAAVYSDLSDMEPDNQEYLYSKAVLLSMAGKYQEAVDAYNLLENKTGLNEQISVAKQQIYMQLGKPDEALKEINKLIESNPSNPQYYGLLAEYYQIQGENEKALEYYNKILEMDPNNGIVQFSLAGYYLEVGDNDTAFEHIKEAFRNDEVDADTKIEYYLANTTNPDDQVWTNKQIEELMDILYEEYPDDNRMYTIYAQYFISQNDLVKAREYLRKFLETDKSTFIIWQQLLYMDNDLQDYEALYNDSKEALGLFPNQSILYAYNAVGALQLKKYQEALNILDEGETYVVDDQDLQKQFDMYKAEANYQLGNVEAAFSAFDDVLKIDPQNYMVMNNYAYYLSLRGENLEKAEQLSSQVVQANPDNSTYLDTYAWVLFKRGNYSLAKFYMESAIENMLDDSDVLYEHYGDILFKNGETEKAMENWEKAKTLGGGSDELDQKINESRYIESVQP